jgi:hypothetical protein
MNRYSEEFYSWIKVLNNVVETRDAYTQGHSVRVAYYSKRIGEKLGLSETQLDDLHIAGLLHDIGKVGIPDSILHKPGRLDNEERVMIQMHSEISSQLLQNAVHLEEILPMIRHHHEQMDGSGYPDCTDTFINKIQNAMNQGTKDETNLEIITPLVHMSKAQIVQKSLQLNVPLKYTWSCYANEHKACGVCDSCRLRLKGFQKANLKDKIPYENRV